MKKRILSILLTCIMVIGMLPAAVFAADAAPAETPVVVPEGYVGVEISVSKEVNNTLVEAEFSFTIQKAVKANLTVAPEEIDMLVLENKVKVSDGYSNADTVTIAVPEEKAREFAANYTVTIEEVDEGELGWTYDKNVATVTFKYGNDGLEVDSISNSEYSGLNTIAYFFNAYDLVKLTVPFKKVVEVAGEGEAPEEAFTFEAYVLSGDAWNYDEVDEDKICGAIEAGAEADAAVVVETTGAGEYAGAIDLYFTARELDGPAKVIVIVEKAGGAMHWTYAENAYAVMIYPPADINSFDGYTPEDVFCTVTYYEAKVDVTSVEFAAGENDAMGEGEVLTFTNTYTAPEDVTIEIPFTKVVELGSNGVPGEETFEFEVLFPFFTSENITVDDVAVVTNGADEYEGKVVITVSEDEIGNLSEGFILREVQGNVPYWEYDETAWFIQRNWNADTAEEPSFVFCKAVYEEAEDATVEGGWIPDVNNPEDEIVFTNTYTREVSRFERDIRILLRSVFDVEASASEGGSISKPGISKVFFKHAIKYTITPAEGYEIEAVYVDGKNVGAVESYIFRDVTKDHTIYAVFAAVEG